MSMSVADEENGSGIGTCYICYKMPITGKTKEDFFRYNAENGKVAYSKEIDEVTESGIWQVKYIKIYDNSRNVTELYDRRSYPTTADAVLIRSMSSLERMRQNLMTRQKEVAHGKVVRTLAVGTLMKN